MPLNSITPYLYKMKIFRFFPHNKTANDTLYNDVDVTTIPDTALLIQKRPFFIPDFTKQCMAQLVCCIRINRLGRSINQRFAHRYYNVNDITLGVHFIAHDLLEQLQHENRPWELAIGFDNAVVVAEKKCDTLTEQMRADLLLNDMTYTCQFETKPLLEAIDKQIERISEFYTMRQGDILLMPLEMEEQPVHIDDNIKLSLNNTHLVSFNIK